MGKVQRVLEMYTRLIRGGTIKKAEEAEKYGVDEHTIRRDIADINRFFEDEFKKTGIMNQVVYDESIKVHRLEQIYDLKLTNSEILALCKILLDSRAFTKAEMTNMLDKLIACCVPEDNKELVKELVRNEEFHYVEPRHGTLFINKMWDIGQAIQHCQYIEIDYFRLKDKSVVKRKIRPVSIMFSEYYFYLAAFIDDEEVRKDFNIINDSYPTIYRIDRIKEMRVLDEKFHIPYKDRFEEGEFRKRIQFMYGGKLEKVKFKYKGLDIDAVLDRLPTAQVLDEENGVYTVSAEVFGKGMEMWLRSQGENVVREGM